MKSRFAGLGNLVAGGALAVAFSVGVAGGQQCKKDEQGGNNWPTGACCYCATVSEGYQECSCPRGNCEDCRVSGHCPAPGGGGGDGRSKWEVVVVNWDGADSCNGGWFCPAECQACW